MESQDSRVSDDIKAALTERRGRVLGESLVRNIGKRRKCDALREPMPPCVSELLALVYQNAGKATRPLDRGAQIGFGYARAEDSADGHRMAGREPPAEGVN